MNLLTDEFQTVAACPAEPFAEHHNVTSAHGLAKFSAQFGRIHGPLSLVVCIFGIPANMVNIVVLTRKGLAETATNHLLLWLAISDVFLMLMYAPCLYHFYLIKPHPVKKAGFSPSLAWVKYHEIFVSGALMFHSMALWTAVLLALFRYLHIGFLQLGPRIATRSRAFKSALTTALLCFISIIPNILVNHVSSCYGPVIPDLGQSGRFNSSTIQLYYYVDSSPSNPRLGEPYPNQTSLTLDYLAYWRTERLHIVNVWLQAVITKIAPSFLLLILTMLLVHELQLAMRRRQHLHANRRKSKQVSLANSPNPRPVHDERSRIRKENQKTLLLLSIVLTFLVVELPQGVLVMCIHLIDDFYNNVYRHLGDLMDFLTLVNEAINFIIYTTMSTRFRTTFYQLCCPSYLKKFVHTNPTSVMSRPAEQTRLCKPDQETPDEAGPRIMAP